MKYTTVFSLLAALTMTIALSGHESHARPLSQTLFRAAAPAQELKPSGTQVGSAKVEEVIVMLPDQPEATGEEILSVLEKNEALARDVTFLRNIDRIVENKEGTYDFYSQGHILMIIETKDEDLVVRSSIAPFKPDSVTYRLVTGEDAQEAKESLIFNLKDCKAPQRGQTAQPTCTKAQVELVLKREQQGQGQGQGQGQEQGQKQKPQKP